MLHLAGRVAFGVDVGNLLELERAFQRNREMDSAAQKQKITRASPQNSAASKALPRNSCDTLKPSNDSSSTSGTAQPTDLYALSATGVACTSTAATSTSNSLAQAGCAMNTSSNDGPGKQLSQRKEQRMSTTCVPIAPA